MIAAPYRLIFIGALLVRFAAAVATGGLWTPEVAEYDDIARNMLAGRGFTYYHLGVTYSSYSPPLYPWLTAAAYWTTGSIVPLILLQTFAGAATASITAWIAGRLFSSWIAGVAAGALVALHPGLIVYSTTKAHPLTFDAFFFTLAALQLLRLADRPTTRRAVELGLVIGIGTLSRATIIIFLPIAALWLLAMTPRSSWLGVVRLVTVMGLCTTAAVAPWTVRNGVRHDRFVFMVTTDSEVFWRGNNPHATGHSYIDANRIVLEALPPDERRDLRRQPNEIAQASWFQARANAYIREDPAGFVRLTLLKFLYFWSFSPQTGVLYPRGWFVLYLAYYAVAVLLAFLGIWNLAHAGHHASAQGLVLGAFVLSISALQSLYYVEGRHRWAVEPLVLAFSGGGVAAVAQRYRHTVLRS